MNTQGLSTSAQAINENLVLPSAELNQHEVMRPCARRLMQQASWSEVAYWMDAFKTDQPITAVRMVAFPGAPWEVR